MALSLFDKLKLIGGKHYYFKKFSELTRLLNINERIIILSFDCDTIKDAEASLQLTDWLHKRKIPAVFAVPGATLAEAEDKYKQVAAKGFDFINHGYLPHMQFNEHSKNYESITWYHEMNEEAVVKDILDADAVLRSTFVDSPLGFRAPHFGYFQEKEQLNLIYSTIIKLGYTYSSTTTPSLGISEGPVLKTPDGIFEFPLSGTYDYPYRILDSWNYIASKNGVKAIDNYSKQFKKTIAFYAKNNLPCILNYYVDPSHVYKIDGFYDCLAFATGKGFRFHTYTQIIERLKK